MTRLAFFGELARIQIELKAESFEANIDAQRVRLDCDREASHNLNRLLDKPG